MYVHQYCTDVYRPNHEMNNLEVPALNGLSFMEHACDGDHILLYRIASWAVQALLVCFAWCGFHIEQLLSAEDAGEEGNG